MLAHVAVDHPVRVRVRVRVAAARLDGDPDRLARRERAAPPPGDQRCLAEPPAVPARSATLVAPIVTALAEGSRSPGARGE